MIEDIDHEFHQTNYKWAELNHIVSLKYRGGDLGEWLYNMGQNSSIILMGQVPVRSQNQYYIFSLELWPKLKL